MSISALSGHLVECPQQLKALGAGELEMWTRFGRRCSRSESFLGQPGLAQSFVNAAVDFVQKRIVVGLAAFDLGD